MERADLGFSPNNVLNFTIDPHEAGYNADQGREFLQALDSRASALPGVENASLAMTVPMGYYSYGMELKIDGYQSPAGQRAPSAGYNAVSPRYFETMHIPLLRGRDFRDSDAATSPYVAVINEAMAEKYWRGENPIGRHFVNTIDPKHSIEIVGIVQNSRTDGNFSDPVAPYLYVALSQHYDYQKPVTLQLRANVPPATVNREVFDMIHRAAPAMSIFDVQTMSEALDTLNGFMLFQIGAGLAASLGILGLVLALVGVYGVVSYSASQRTHEIGIRVALGAQPADVLRMILRQGLLIVGAGLLSGILAAAAIAPASAFSVRPWPSRRSIILTFARCTKWARTKGGPTWCSSFSKAKPSRPGSVAVHSTPINCWIVRCRSVMLSMRRTAKGCCTATSNRRTSGSRPAATSRCSISAWRGWRPMPRAVRR